jgi:hypothetical protein
MNVQIVAKAAASRRRAPAVKSLHQLKIIGLKGLAEPRLKWTIQPQQGVEALAQHDLPTCHYDIWGLRPKPHRVGGVGIRLSRI